MSALTVNTTQLRKLGLTRRLLIRAWNWLQEEYRLSSQTRIRSKAENGDARAQYNLAVICDSADSAAQPENEAIKWYKKAAFQGVPEAQLALGLKYLQGLGVPRNDSEAVLWLRKAAEQGQAEAQYQLAELYREGRGTSRDLLQASKWYRKAADRGHAAAKQSFKDLNSNVLTPQLHQVPSEDPGTA